MKTSSTSMRQSLLKSIEAAIVSILLTSLVAVAYMVTLPTPEAAASQTTNESFARWKRSMYMPAAIVALIQVPVIVAIARFASVYPSQPVKFQYSLAVTAIAAAIAHLATSPVKGSPNHVATLVGAIAAAAFLTFIGFHRAEVPVGTGEP